MSLTQVHPRHAPLGTQQESNVRPTIYLISQSTDEENERPDGVMYYDPHGEFKEGKGFERFQKNFCISAGKE